MIIVRHVMLRYSITLHTDLTSILHHFRLSYMHSVMLLNGALLYITLHCVMFRYSVSSLGMSSEAET